MSQFTKINEIYKTYFGSAPPTRACVGIQMQEEDGYRMKLEGIARRDEGRKSLHVQSISYWSAANIGPYSQTITVRPSSPVPLGLLRD